MSTIADLGVVQGPLEQMIMEEVMGVCEEIRKKATSNKGNLVSIERLFAPAANNVICRFASGKRTRQDDPDLIEMMEASKDVFLLWSTDLFKMAQMYSMCFSKLCQWFGVKNNVYEVSEKLNKKLHKLAAQGHADKDGSFIERHLYMQEELKDNQTSVFCKRQGMDYLWGGLFDMFLAGNYSQGKAFNKNLLTINISISGTDTTSTFMEWVLIFLMTYPDIQAKVFREIQETLGGREATLQDRSRLPYVNCFIEEVGRVCQMVDLAGAHQVEEDTVFRGFLFPKGTQVFGDMSAVRTEPSYWKDTDEFRPERYLTAGGQFQAEERIAPFGVGKRRCMGEVLARAEAFLFTVGVVQNFEFRQNGETGPPSLLPMSGMIGYPQNYNAVVIPRT